MNNQTKYLTIKKLKCYTNIKSRKIPTNPTWRSKMVGNNGKYLFGICKIGEKGQIVIPKEAREVFGIKSGDSLVILGDVKKGIAIVKADVLTSITEGIMGKDDDE